MPAYLISRSRQMGLYREAQQMHFKTVLEWFKDTTT